MMYKRITNPQHTGPNYKSGPTELTSGFVTNLTP